MGVFLNRTFDDGSVTALWRITESEGKSLSEQRLAVDALIDNVFEGQFRLCHDVEGVPILNPAKGRNPESGGSDHGIPPAPFVSVSHTKGWAAVMTNPKNHVGIDIEPLVRNFSAVEKKTLCPAELSRLDDWAETLRERNTVLGLLWCAKEAVYKRLTVPATDFENQIEIETIVPTSTDKGKIMAIFFGDTVIIRIRLEYAIIFGLLMVYTTT